jgi:SagB-type dehydrogenase family enzyme
VRNDETEAALAYHRRTSHLRADGPTAGLAADWANQPRPFKVYPRLPAISLPALGDDARMPAMQAVASAGASDGEPTIPTTQTLATLLHYSAGIVRRLRLPGSGRELQFRAASCTGALYHVDLYVVCGPLDGLDAGVYQYGPQDEALRLLRAGDYRAALAQACGDHPAVSEAPLALVLTTTSWRNGWRYGERAYRHAFWDSGTILANLLAVATAHGLPATVLAGFVDRSVNRLLDLDGQKEVALAVVPLGSAPTDVPPPAPGPPVMAMGHWVSHYSTAERDFPAILAMHLASSLSAPEEVRSWRSGGDLTPRRREDLTPRPPLRRGEGEASDVERLTPRLGIGSAVERCSPSPRRRGGRGVRFTSIEAAIRARGSARRFAPEAISSESLHRALGTALSPFAADYRPAPDRPLVACLLVVNAVEAMPPGIYRYEPDDPELRLLEPRDDARELAGRLALDEARAADAAVLVVFLSSLPDVLGRLGNRGYRAAQLDAGILTGRLYLAAQALGLGVTGLTFYDDEVDRVFERHAPGCSGMLTVALGVARQERAPSSEP